MERRCLSWSDRRLVLANRADAFGKYVLSVVGGGTDNRMKHPQGIRDKI